MEKDMNLYVGGGIIIVVLFILIIIVSMNTRSSCRSEDVIQRSFDMISSTLVVPVVNPIPYSALSGELVVQQSAGVVVTSGTNYIRVTGSATTTYNDVGTTKDQIQIYNAGKLTAAFDVSGLYVNALNVTGNSVVGGTLDVTGSLNVKGKISGITWGYNFVYPNIYTNSNSYTINNNTQTVLDLPQTFSTSVIGSTCTYIIIVAPFNTGQQYSLIGTIISFVNTNLYLNSTISSTGSLSIVEWGYNPSTKNYFITFNKYIADNYTYQIIKTS